MHHPSLLATTYHPSSRTTITLADMSSSHENISKTTMFKVDKIHSIVASDINDRGMKYLVVEGDLLEAAKLFARLPLQLDSGADSNKEGPDRPTLLILSGFPCLVSYTPPTETDGPNGALALALCATALGYKAIICTDDCNVQVFSAGLSALLKEYPSCVNFVQLKSFPDDNTITAKEDEEMNKIAQEASLVIACERAGPAHDGKCYTMRGIDMNAHNLIAPLHKMAEVARAQDTARGIKFIGIGDGGNELGMGKVIQHVYTHIPLGEKIGCVLKADYLIAASVSNWGAYALCGAAALIRAETENNTFDATQEWMMKCLVTEEADLKILKECMAAGCRDGINQRLDEPYVDGMPVEKSLECLRGIWGAALEHHRD